jgi:hypothetical protein
MKDPVSWSEKGDDYENVRQELLKLLSNGSEKRSTKTSVSNAIPGK